MPRRRNGGSVSSRFCELLRTVRQARDGRPRLGRGRPFHLHRSCFCCPSFFSELCPGGRGRRHDVVETTIPTCTLETLDANRT